MKAPSYPFNKRIWKCRLQSVAHFVSPQCLFIVESYLYSVLFKYIPGNVYTVYCDFIWWLWWQKQIFTAGISYYIPQFTEGVYTAQCRYNAVKKPLYCIQYYSDWDRTKSEVELTKDAPYLALTGELWGVFCEDLDENWPRCNALHCICLCLCISDSGTKVLICSWLHCQRFFIHVTIWRRQSLLSQSQWSNTGRLGKYRWRQITTNHEKVRAISMIRWIR